MPKTCGTTKQDIKEIKMKRKQRVCCACKKTKKIVNVGGPPLCAECFPLACNWSKAFDKHQDFMMSLAGITPLEINIGRDDDIAYFLEEVSKYLAEVKMRIKQTEICLINICTMLRNEEPKVSKKRAKQLQIEIIERGNKETIIIPPTKPKWKRVVDNSEWEAK